MTATPSDADIHAMVRELGLPGAIRYALRLGAGSGPLSGFYSLAAERLAIYKAACEQLI